MSQVGILNVEGTDANIDSPQDISDRRLINARLFFFALGTEATPLENAQLEIPKNSMVSDACKTFTKLA